MRTKERRQFLWGAWERSGATEGEDERIGRRDQDMLSLLSGADRASKQRQTSSEGEENQSCSKVDRPRRSPREVVAEREASEPSQGTRRLSVQGGGRRQVRRDILALEWTTTRSTYRTHPSLQ